MGGKIWNLKHVKVRVVKCYSGDFLYLFFRRYIFSIRSFEFRYPVPVLGRIRELDPNEFNLKLLVLVLGTGT